MAKFCFNCGTQLPDGTVFCANCGTRLPDDAAVQPEPQAQFTAQPVQRPQPQTTQYYQQPQQYYQPQGAYQPAPAPKKSKKGLFIAIAAILVAGIAIGVLFLTGVFGGGDKLVGTWISNTDDVMVLNADGTGTLNDAGITYRTNDGIITITLGSTSYSYTYKLDGDRMLFYEDDRSFPTVSFTRDTGETPRSSEEPSSSEEPEPSSSEPEPEPEPVPDFEELGITPHLMQPGITRSYVTGDRNDENATAVGVICVDSYTKGAISDEASAFLQGLGVDLTGYTARKASFSMSFPSGVDPHIFYEFEDYYDITTYDGYDYAALDEDRYWYEAQVEINGVKKSVYIYNVTDVGESEAYLGTIDAEVIVPDGYDGFCYAFIDSRLGDDVGVQSEYFDLYEPDNILFFRFY